MTLLETLTRDRLAAFKAGDRTRATLLATVIAEARAGARREAVREPDDDELLAKVRKFIKNNEEAMASGRAETVAKLKAENEILAVYLPKMLDDEALKALITPIVEQLSDRSPRATGQVMARLKAVPGVDMRRASLIVKQMLGGK
ncbi:MAG TPA: hypothetical protein ENF48_01495 [Desulfobacteraceae bacterium]|nr:GatB/YqeY domain-containing protein [Deltaproteobacteria bacterium]HDI59026.1 hypothetical protein [Desulfobacteraceae bacterium]